ncbi:hypothetical protein NDU88_003118 [Pleurodeles waltl]|uniref:Uncharacterized protein n=1 Tax=Pleurodeles waltl TaxID=8319 RepID=A0AAV7Q8S7_PLEWA|nr:hypothetical protein NDU88_003118 [Pleurodeles waltl]
MLAEDARVHLDEELTENEIALPLAGLQPVMAPGPNGFPVEFFKTFMPQLGKHDMQVLQNASDTELLPLEWRQADIVAP